VCRANEATRLCDGVVRGARWALCSKPICEACVTRHGASEFCTACALLRGYITREPGEDDR
jgi:hypothetical protein